MGIRLEFLELFDSATQALANKPDAAWIMGSQQCSFTADAGNAWLAKHGYGAPLGDGWTDDPAPVFQAMGYSSYVDVDINDLARRKLDLVEPLPDDCHHQADLVVDAGTLEHIFELPAALRNMNRILKPGGVILHLTPVNFFDHGFINVNPCLYHDFYKANGYTQLFLTFQMTIHNPLRIPRISPWMPFRLARFTLPYKNPDGVDWVRFMRRLSAITRLPRNLLVVGAFRKEDERAEFNSPTDIWDN
jgi:SAM-dependent methyltransferase